MKYINKLITKICIFTFNMDERNSSHQNQGNIALRFAQKLINWLIKFSCINALYDFFENFEA